MGPARPGGVVRVGLTGGIGSGKSTVSALLRDHGAVIVDYDQIAREVVEPGTPGLAAIVERFGPEVLGADGSLDRPALGAIVFADESARRDLEAITHPAVRARAAELEGRAGPGDVVVHDIPLLAESGERGPYDVVVVVDVPREVQVDRLVRDRGMSLDEAQARIGAQASRDDRAAVADVIVDNSGSLEELTARVRDLWRELSAG
ncbi:MAG: dephospho-CoA kinase [Aeromicrobium sp.]|uniref:dephospho-CoA kinase n=1 Tax=Aeromicrobium sp. TaxID=1871063 RepID=UPI002605B0ED|nr:dephospho-CoA kinase [Aeromicrobium sp.]MDF1703335.1 dephospho-CoA kinase [Aeromicrobium sp.]